MRRRFERAIEKLLPRSPQNRSDGLEELDSNLTSWLALHGPHFWLNGIVALSVACADDKVLCDCETSLAEAVLHVTPAMECKGR